MPKFSDIVAGTRALSDPQTVEIAPGVTITVRFRVLAPFESSSVLSAARAEAKAQGVDEPEVGEPLYEAAFKAHTLAFAIVDPDSKADDPKPYFDGGVEQVKHSKLLTDDVIAYLFELWELWRDSVSLQKVMLDEVTFGRVMEAAGISDARPFLGLRPGARWNFTRTLAARHMSLLRSRSQPSSGSPETPSQSQPLPEPPQDQTPAAEP